MIFKHCPECGYELEGAPLRDRLGISHDAFVGLIVVFVVLFGFIVGMATIITTSVCSNQHEIKMMEAGYVRRERLLKPENGIAMGNVTEEWVKVEETKKGD